MWRRRREPLFTIAVRSERPRCTVVFEPVGSIYELLEDDEIVIHVFERSATDRPDEDLEIYHADEQIQLWLPHWNYRVLNKVGDEVQV